MIVMRRRDIIALIIVLLAVAAVFAWKILGPGPMAFAGGSTVGLADYHAADPTGVPAANSAETAVTAISITRRNCRLSAISASAPAGIARRNIGSVVAT